MKFKKYIAASMIALAGLTACSDSFLDTDYTEYLDEEAAGEAAGKNPDVFLNGMWSWMVFSCPCRRPFGVVASFVMRRAVTPVGIPAIAVRGWLPRSVRRP